MSPIAEFDQLSKPEQSTLPGQEVFGADPSLHENTHALRAFVGPKADYYLGKWAPRLQDPDSEVGVNWAAFFLSGFWLGYRKMYKTALIFYGVVIGLWLLQVGVFMFGLGMPHVPLAVTLLVILMVCIACGAFGNGWYLALANRTVAAARAQGVDGEQLQQMVAPRGGTSLKASLGFFFVPALVLVALFVAEMFVLALYTHTPDSW